MDDMTEDAVHPDLRSAASQSPPAEPSVGELVTQLSEQSSKLLRSELELAVAEMQQKAKHAGIGAGLFGTAGITTLFGVGTLITTAILALALVLPAWSAALIVTVALFVVAAVVALVGKRHVSEATPPTPQRTLGSVKRDIETVKESLNRDDTR